MLDVLAVLALVPLFSSDHVVNVVVMIARMPQLQQCPDPGQRVQSTKCVASTSRLQSDIGSHRTQQFRAVFVVLAKSYELPMGVKQ